jgi:hypothetical protein
MRILYLAAVVVTILPTALAGIANAGDKGLGGAGSGPPSIPPGFGSTGGHKGFETYSNPTNTPSSKALPQGWGSGNADWKSGLQGTSPDLTTRPPGLSGH